MDSVEQAAMSLGEIAGSIRNITVMNQQVAEATKQQSEVSEDINRNITAIQQIAEMPFADFSIHLVEAGHNST